jgi:hypothetical protein
MGRGTVVKSEREAEEVLKTLEASLSEARWPWARLEVSIGLYGEPSSSLSPSDLEHRPA